MKYLKEFLIIFAVFWGAGFLCGVGYQAWRDRCQMKACLRRMREQEKEHEAF